MPGPKTDDGRVVYEVTDLMKLLPVRRAAAYALAKKLGIRIGRRRLVVPKTRFDAWLNGEKISGGAS
jgi:hypothetical protein